MLFLHFFFFTLLISKLILNHLKFAYDLRTYLKPLITPLHQECLIQTNTFQQNEAAAALVCGANIDSMQLQSLFASTGLIHLLVVSGSHLLILQKIFHYLTRRIEAPQIKIFIQPLKYTLLMTFVLMCEFNAPATRSLIALGLADFVRYKKWGWSSSLRQWVSTLLCLFLNPTWLLSLSFQMSWMSSLALDVCSHLPCKNEIAKNFYRSLIICGSFSLIFCFLGFPSGWTPIISLLFSPILEMILFPLALVGGFFHPLASIFDFVFSLITRILTALGTEKHFLFFLDRSSVLYFNLFIIILLIAISLGAREVKS
jgi:ComEC/Rec2-related protein